MLKIKLYILCYSVLLIYPAIYFVFYIGVPEKSGDNYYIYHYHVIKQTTNVVHFISLILYSTFIVGIISTIFTLKSIREITGERVLPKLFSAGPVVPKILIDEIKIDNKLKILSIITFIVLPAKIFIPTLLRIMS